MTFTLTNSSSATESLYSDIDNNINDIEDNINTDNPSFTTYLNSICHKKLLAPEEEKALGFRILNGDKKAKKELVEHNYRLVIFFAKKYAKPEISIMDLIQDGNIGLMKAADKFDVTKGYKFSTYASYWIVQYMKRGITNTFRSIRIPDHMHEKIERIRFLCESEKQINGTEPSADELCKISGYSKKDVELILSSEKDMISLDILVGQNKDTRIEELLTDTCSPLPESIAESNELSLNIRQIISTLDEREQGILLLRYGFYDGAPKSLEEISVHYGLSRERIRQIESKALNTLKKNQEIYSMLSQYR